MTPTSTTRELCEPTLARISRLFTPSIPAQSVDAVAELGDRAASGWQKSVNGSDTHRRPPRGDLRFDDRQASDNLAPGSLTRDDECRVAVCLGNQRSPRRVVEGMGIGTGRHKPKPAVVVHGHDGRAGGNELAALFSNRTGVIRHWTLADRMSKRVASSTADATY